MKMLDSTQIPIGKIRGKMIENTKPINVKKDFSREVYSSLCFPSTAHAYSVCIQAMQNWFLERLNAKEGYFKTIFVDGKNVLDDYREMSDLQKLKRLKPSLAIRAQADLDFDNDRVYAALYGAQTYVRRTSLDLSFFKDKARHMFLGVENELLLMNFEFAVRLSTRAQQLDMYKRIQVSHRVGFTETVNLSVDFHVPYGLIVQVAKDAGFEVNEKDEIVNVSELVRYLNFNSTVPFLLKFRNINGKYEFFIRIDNLPMHILTNSLDKDDGSRENQVDSNFMLNLSCTVRFPVPKFYVYYSEHKHLDIERLENVGERLGLHTIKLAEIPEVNQKGWNLYLTTEIHEEEPDKPMTVDFSELFTGDLREVMRATTDNCISCGTFMEIKLITSTEELDYEIDWCNLTVKTLKPPVENVVYVGVYVDLLYLNDYIITSRNLATNRLTMETDNPFKSNS